MIWEKERKVKEGEGGVEGDRVGEGGWEGGRVGKGEGRGGKKV